MNILFISDPRSVHNYKMTTWLSENRGYNCLMICYEESCAGLNEKKSWANDYEAKGVKILSPIPFFSIRHTFRTLKTARRIKKIIEEYRIDVIVVTYLEPSALWTIFRRYFGTPFLLYAYGTDVLKAIPSFFQAKSIFKRVIAKLYIKSFRRADFLAATSCSQLKRMANLFGNNLNMGLIRTGVDVEKILSDTRQFFPEILHNIDGFIFFPRNMHPIYNHELAISAIKLLPENIKRRYSFVFLNNDSTDSKYVSTIKMMMADIKDTSIYFLSSLSQEAMFEMYKRASLVIMTPKSDGSPVSAMEALICGSPVILPPLDYDSDLFSCGVHILNSWDPMELSNSITSILSGEMILDTVSAIDNIKHKGNILIEMEKLDQILGKIKGIDVRAT